MKSILAALVLLSLCGAAMAAPTREEALKAIATLERDLLSDAADEACRTIAQFAQESEEVTLTLGRDTVPWILEERTPNESDDAVYLTLLAVYYAGNAKSQLLAGKVEDDPYSGWMAAIRAYRQIQSRRSIHIPSLEKLSEMESMGTLRAHAREVKLKEKELNQPSDRTRSARGSI